MSKVMKFPQTYLNPAERSMTSRLIFKLEGIGASRFINPLILNVIFCISGKCRSRKVCSAYSNYRIMSPSVACTSRIMHSLQRRCRHSEHWSSRATRQVPFSGQLIPPQQTQLHHLHGNQSIFQRHYYKPSTCIRLMLPKRSMNQPTPVDAKPV